MWRHNLENRGMKIIELRNDLAMRIFPLVGFFERIRFAVSILLLRKIFSFDLRPATVGMVKNDSLGQMSGGIKAVHIQ